jgi:alpha-tubulin suppressor-like RCC1 family protein
VRVSGIKNATQVSAGDTNNCVLLSNREIKCWGDNFDGQLGDGMKKGGPTSVRVSGIKNATQVSVGDEHACALLSSHRVDCWGDNRYGKLGDGVKHHGFKNTYGIDISPAPVQVSGIKNATAISAGGEYTCALLSSGRVECWGYDAYGQLGNGKIPGGRYPHITTPVTVKDITNAVQLSAGELSACAVLSNHKVKCWGVTPTAQGPAQKVSLVPVPVKGTTDAVQVSSSEYHSCVLLADHEVECWGYIVTSQPEVASLTPFPIHVTLDSSTPVPVSGITDAISISAGIDYTCALLPGGTLKCWGDNDDGELGNGGKTGIGTASSTPVTVIGPR